MHNPYNFTYAITYRHGIDKLLNLRKVLDSISGFVGIDIIIVEQDTVSKLPPFSIKGFRHIFTRSDLPFNHGWARNVAMRNARGNAIVFGTSDHIADTGELAAALNTLTHHDAVTMEGVIDLLPHESHMPSNTWKSIQRPYRIGSRCEGIVAYRSEAIGRLGGWSEDFFGEECVEFAAFQETKMRILNTGVYPGRVYRLPHIHRETKPHQKSRNTDIFSKLNILDDVSLQKYWRNSQSRMGMVNRYADR